MINFQTPGRLIFAGLEMPPRSMIGLSETHDMDGEYEEDRTLNGSLELLRPAWAALHDHMYTVDLTASGDTVEMPPIDDLLPGYQVIFHSGVWWSKTLQAGETELQLRRYAVPGSAMGRNPRLMNSTNFPIEVLGRMAYIAAPLPHPLVVYYRPIFLCTITKNSALTAERFGRSKGYGLRLVETEPTT